MPPVVDRSLLQHRLARAFWVLAALFLFVGLVVRTTALGDVLDSRTLAAVRPLDTPETYPGWVALTKLGSPASYLPFCLALMLVAAVRRRWRWTLIVPVTMLGSELMAQILKRVLAQPRPDVVMSGQIGDAAWPSGHSTAAMTVALLAVMIAPRRMRPTIAVLGAFGALGVGFGMVAVGAHYPTDIIGGYLCAALWVTAAAIAVLEWQRRRPGVRPVDRPATGARHLAGPVLLLALGGATAVSLAARDGDGVVGTIRDHTVAVVVLGGVIALALTLVALVATLPDTREGPGPTADGPATTRGAATDGPPSERPVADGPGAGAPGSDRTIADGRVAAGRD